MFLNPVITSCSKHLECYRDNFDDKRYLRLNVRLKIWFIILVKSNLQNQINSITISNTLYIDLDWIRLQTCSISLYVRVISNSPFEKPRISGVRFSHFPHASMKLEMWTVKCASFRRKRYKLGQAYKTDKQKQKVIWRQKYNLTSLFVDNFGGPWYKFRFFSFFLSIVWPKQVVDCTCPLAPLSQHPAHTPLIMESLCYFQTM